MLRWSHKGTIRCSVDVAFMENVVLWEKQLHGKEHFTSIKQNSVKNALLFNGIISCCRSFLPSQ
uniref:Uncharacterized protein n=1 Tax=Rhizophora mucronata TaxID=61149 RepID=A0A2P2KKV1_RHIMU